MPYFTYRQNNSGGVFCGPAINVIIKAKNAKKANKKAEEAGLYFDGCRQGIDCYCCGDRWYEKWENEEGNEVPSIYDIPVEEYEPTFSWATDRIPEYVIIK